MNAQEKELVKNLLVKDYWYKTYVSLLVKATDLTADKADLLVKASKPELTNEQVEQLFDEVFASVADPVAEETTELKEE